MSGKRSSFVCAPAVIVKVVKRMKTGRKTRIDTSLLSKGLSFIETTSQLICANAHDAQAVLRPVGGSGFKLIVKSPLDRTLFGSIDLRQFILAVEESAHVVHQEGLGFGI